MRELKFRAWDIDNKQFIYARIGQDDVGLDDGISTIEMPLHHSDFEQYTGLKDKNGKEIYDGDIVLNTYYDDDEMYKVLWADDSVAFGMESLEDMELYKLPLESLKVIGNIHENPELLEKEDAE